MRGSQRAAVTRKVNRITELLLEDLKDPKTIRHSPLLRPKTLSSRFYLHRLPNMLPTFDLFLFSTTIKLKKSCLIFWSISTATIHVSITLCALVTSVCLVTFMISVCLVLFIHLLWHVTHVWLHVLQVRFQFSFLSFFPLFYCSCKVIIIIIIITQTQKRQDKDGFPLLGHK